MKIKAEEFDDTSRFRQILKLEYGDIVNFVLEYLGKKSRVTLFFWTFCLITLGLALVIRINISGLFSPGVIFTHTLLGFILFPVAVIPVHELLHIIPYYLTGAKKIRVGMDLKQYIFFVTAHRHVVTPSQFRIVALFPFVAVTLAMALLVFTLPGVWKWSISLFLFVHTTMCAGDFSMLNFFHLNRNRKLYTWDDADLREAYFYEEI